MIPTGNLANRDTGIGCWDLNLKSHVSSRTLILTLIKPCTVNGNEKKDVSLTGQISNLRRESHSLDPKTFVGP